MSKGPPGKVCESGSEREKEREIERDNKQITPKFRDKNDDRVLEKKKLQVECVCVAERYSDR